MEDAIRLSRDELEVRVQERTADLTRSNERLQAEIAARARAEETLREQAALLDLTHDTVFVRDERDVITYWNRGAEELYGWTKAEAIREDAGVGLGAEARSPVRAVLLDETGRPGQGLSISRSIIERHGGRPWATANPDHGATFHLARPGVA